MYEVKVRGSLTHATIRSWNSSPFSNPGDSGALTFGIQGGHIYALAVHQQGPRDQAAGKVAMGTSLASAITFAQSRSRNGSLAFDQSKTCVLSSTFLLVAP